MGERATIPATVVVNIIFYSLILNVLIMALGFGIVAGVSWIRGGDLSPTFAPAAGFLTMIAGFIGVIRSYTATLIEELAF